MYIVSVSDSKGLTYTISDKYQRVTLFSSIEEAMHYISAVFKDVKWSKNSPPMGNIVTDTTVTLFNIEQCFPFTPEIK